MAITNRHLNSTIFTTIRALLIAQDGNYTSSTQPLITASYPDSYDFTNPVIVISNAATGESDFTFDRSSSNKNVVVLIDIFVNKNKDRDMLGDDVRFFLKSKIDGITLINIEEINNTDIVNNQKVRNKAMTFTYVRR